MLRKRLIASACFILPVLGIFWLDANWNFGLAGMWTVLATATMSLVIAGEFAQMVEGRTAGVDRLVIFPGVLACHLAMVMPGIVEAGPNRWAWSCGVLLVVLVAAVLREVARYQPERKSVERVALTLFATVYAGWLLSYLSAVRVIHPGVGGVFAIFSILFIIKMSDAGAYFVGKNLGRTKLAPVLSPGKTVEGLIGGLIAGIVAAVLAFWAIKPWMGGEAVTNWWAVVGYALSITIVGVLGDLSESMIKREMGVKDSSSWLPGLGGIMDTADSVILAAPLAFGWWASGLL